MLGHLRAGLSDSESARRLENLIYIFCVLKFGEFVYHTKATLWKGVPYDADGKAQAS